MLNAKFWKGAGERALKTFIQSFISSLVVGVGAATTAWEVEWLNILWLALGIALLATFGSLATSLGNASFTAGVDKEVDITITARHADARDTLK